jgi:Ycf66 protein N-terminus
MVNFGFNSASILGILLALAGGGLYLLRSLRPEISRDHDIFFAAVGLLCGGILFFHGWRLDPILQFSQLLLAGSAAFFAFESVRLRGFATQQAKGRSGRSYVDDDRPVSRVYRAELEDEDMYEDEYDYPEEPVVQRRRLQGSPPRNANARRRGYEEQEQTSRPRRSSRDYDDDNYASDVFTSRPRRRPASRGDEQYNNNSGQDESENRDDSRSRSSRSARGYDNSSRRSPRQRRPKSANDIASSMGTEYVDYQPLDTDNPQNDNSENYDY